MAHEVDADEAEALTLCPKLTHRDVRAFSYPNVFYEHVRSSIVHEYHLGGHASAWPMTSNEAWISYVNIMDSSSLHTYRQIHFHIEWLVELIRSIARQAENDVLSGPRQAPRSWWVAG